MAGQEKPPMAKPIVKRDAATPRGGFGLGKKVEQTDGISAAISKLLGEAGKPPKPEYDQTVGHLREEISSDFPAPAAETEIKRPDEQSEEFDLTNADLAGWEPRVDPNRSPQAKSDGGKSETSKKEPSYKFKPPEEGIETALLAAAEAAAKNDEIRNKKIEDEKTREEELKFGKGKITSIGDRITVELPSETAGEDRIRSATQAGLSSIGAATRKDKKD